MGMNLLEGRDFDTRDRLGATNVVVVNQTFVQGSLNRDRRWGRS